MAVNRVAPNRASAGHQVDERRDRLEGVEQRPHEQVDPFAPGHATPRTRPITITTRVATSTVVRVFIASFQSRCARMTARQTTLVSAGRQPPSDATPEPAITITISHHGESASSACRGLSRP